MRDLALPDQRSRAARARQQVSIGPARAIAHQSDPVGCGVGRHFQEEGDVHRSVIQSDAGRGLASLTCKATPSTESDPLPGLTHSNSNVPAAST